jgi:hypothetical protein
MTTLYEVEYVHDMILAEAANIANQDLLTITQNDKDWSRHFNTTDIFDGDTASSQLGGLCLTIDPIHTKGRPPEVISSLHDIGRKAVHKSLLKHQDQFVGLILGHARLGLSYFDRWPDHTGQLKLF